MQKHAFIDRWRRFFDGVSSFSALERIKTDAYETDRAWVCMMEIPGISPNHELNVYVQGQSLIVKGESRESRQSGENAYYRREMAFNYMLPIPVPVRAEKLTAQLDGHVLTVRIPKRR